VQITKDKIIAIGKSRRGFLHSSAVVESASKADIGEKHGGDAFHHAFDAVRRKRRPIRRLNVIQAEKNNQQNNAEL
jgi:hypothetical protein